MKRLRVVQVGAGRFTHSDHTMMTVRSLQDDYDVVGVCEPEQASRALAERRPAYDGLPWLDLERVLDDASLDAVLVETDEALQASTALLFAERGFRIHMDKPGGEDISAFESLVETVKQNQSALHLGYMLRFNPAVVELLESIQRGLLGEIICVEAQMSPSRYGREMATSSMEAMRGGMTYYLGCHLIDLVYQIQGWPDQVNVQSVGTRLASPEGLDYGLVTFTCGRGVSFIKTRTTEVAGVLRRQLVVSGTKGTAQIRPLEVPSEMEGVVQPSVTALELSLETDDAGSWRTVVTPFPTYGRYDHMMIDFASIVRGETESNYTPDYELEVFKLVMASCGMADFQR